jgi:hypothetical protein
MFVLCSHDSQTRWVEIMFERLIRELEQLDGKAISLPLQADVEGYYDRECPAEACLFNFKVYGEDWKNICRDEQIFCPACRHAAPSKSWFTRDQIDTARTYARSHVASTINGAMHEDARAWNQRQPRNAFLKITMDVKGASTPILMPIAAAEPMRLKTICEECGCRYSYIGAAFFCPACGANSANHTFRQTLATIRSATAAHEVLTKSFDEDQAEVLRRALLEKGMQDAVMSLQRLAEQVYSKIPNGAPARRNAFQNLDEGGELWSKATGTTYLDCLSIDELRRLRIYFQQRHLLAHRQGIVDEDYRSRSGDTTYSIGQRIIIKKSDVLDFVGLIERLGQVLMHRSVAA